MEVKVFVNYYKILELNPGASAKAIARKFRHLASRYHPDNQDTGDRSKFDLVLKAHDVLKDTASRARYHDEHPEHLPRYTQAVEEDLDDEAADENQKNNTPADDGKFVENLGLDRDTSIQNNLLTMLYLQRRRNVMQPGIGNAELERLSGCSHEHLEFHLWYLKAKGWISTGEDGLLAITVAGVDRAADIFQGERAQKLIADQS